MLEANRIPVPQVQRVALYEQTIGPFGRDTNAYWSLRVGRRVTLAEGAKLDRGYRAGQIPPPIRDRRQIIPVEAPAPRPVGTPALAGVEKVLFRQPRAVSRAAVTAPPPIQRPAFPLPLVLGAGGTALAVVLLMVSLAARRRRV